MKYFQNITTEEEAKQHYRLLAKELHPDRGGSVDEFQKMDREYKALLLRLQIGHVPTPNNQEKPKNDFFRVVKAVTDVLIEREIPQNYFKRKIESSQTQSQKRMYSELLELCETVKNEKAKEKH